MKIRYKLAQAKMYLGVLGNTKHPLHQVIREAKGSRLKRGKSWMAEAEESLRKVCEIEDIFPGEEWREVRLNRTVQTRVKITWDGKGENWTCCD